MFQLVGARYGMAGYSEMLTPNPMDSTRWFARGGASPPVWATSAKHETETLLA